LPYIEICKLADQTNSEERGSESISDKQTNRIVAIPTRSSLCTPELTAQLKSLAFSASWIQTSLLPHTVIDKLTATSIKVKVTVKSGVTNTLIYTNNNRWNTLARTLARRKTILNGILNSQTTENTEKLTHHHSHIWL
jgi:hypothetical protein